MRLLPVLVTLCLAVCAPAAAAAVKVPREARAVDTSHPDRWVGTGTARSCTSRAVVRPWRRAGSSASDCGPARS